MSRTRFIIFLLASKALLGQEPAAAPPGRPPNSVVQVKRVQDSAAGAPVKSDSVVDQFDFDANVRALANSVNKPADTELNAPANQSPSSVPSSYRPATDVKLSGTAQQAVDFSASWRALQNGPAPGPDGRVLFAFGAGLPTVVCAPLRVCLIELQPGEKLVGEPQIGDSVRWNVAPGVYGKGDDETALLVLKPQMAGLDTNLLITTDRRAYYIRLVSKADDYVSRVAFVYNDDDGGEKWKQHFAQQQREEAASARDSAQRQSGLLVAPEHLHFDYEVKGGDESIRPRRVFDDGSKTYILMAAAIANREAPVLVIVGQDGKGEVVNYRMKDQTYIVDRLFEHARLVLGSGKNAQKVEITRDHRE